MADDIVKRLSTQSETVVRLFGSPDGPEETLLPADLLWFTCQDAAAEIERLRAAGDALARLLPHAHLSTRCRAPEGMSLDEWCSECAALAAWQEARRG